MATQSVTQVVSGYHSTAKAAATSLTEDGGAQFMTLLLAQLKNQNPLDPVQDKDFMGQVTQLNSFQELQKMTKLLQELGKSNRLGEAAGLIGKTVAVKNSEGVVKTGLVDGLTLKGDEVLLLVGKDQLPLANVIGVSGGKA